MIIVAYPCATGGKFLASLISLILHNKANKILKNGSLHGTPNGFVQYDVKNTSTGEGFLEAEWEGFQEFLSTIAQSEDTVIVGHMRNLAPVIETYADAKIIYITVSSEEWKDVQEQNFIKKVMRAFWKPRWYKIFCPPGGPEFDPNIDNMPQSFIDGILKINRNYLETWQYNLPIATERLLNLDISCIMNPEMLLTDLIKFLQVEISEERYLLASDFINEYVKINEYDNRQT